MTYQIRAVKEERACRGTSNVVSLVSVNGTLRLYAGAFTTTAHNSNICTKKFLKDISTCN